MQTRQKIALTVFLAGLASFFYFGSGILSKHTAWTDFQTPAGVGEIFGLGFSVVVTIAGALGINVIDLVRKVTDSQFDRRGDPQVDKRKDSQSKE